MSCNDKKMEQKDCGINFISSWPVLSPNTWSGTPYGLLKAISQKVKVKQYTAAAPASRNPILAKVKNILDLLNFGYVNLKKSETLINSMQDLQPGIPSIAFAEYNTKIVKDTYCYQDLTIDFMTRIRKTDSRFNDVVGPLKVASAIAVNKKRKHANAFYENCAGIFTMSEWLKRDLIENTGVSPDKVHYAGGGCNVNVSRIDYSQKRGNRFIFVGKAWQRKNGELVVSAFEKLCAQHPEAGAELYIAGPKECPESVRGKKNIVFLGRLSPEELYNYYNLCDYFVLPSLFEPYGLVFGEALAFGLPCIANNCYAMPEFISHGENGYLLDEQDPELLAGLMEELLINGQEMAKKVQADKEKYIERFSWETVAQRIIDVLKADGYQL